MCRLAKQKQGKFFELISPGGRGCVKGQNVCLHGALCAIPINVICNITTFRKEMFDLLTKPLQHDHIQKSLNFGQNFVDELHIRA